MKLLFRLKSFSELQRYLRAGFRFVLEKIKFCSSIFTDTTEAEKLLKQSAYLLKQARNKKVAVVLPTYNEKDNIELVVKKIQDVLPNADIVVIDDNSPDHTGDIADKMSEINEKISVIHRSEKKGLGTAYKEGFRFVLENLDADYLFEMDADLSHNPEYLPIFLHFANFYDLVSGSRFHRRVSIKNRSLWRNVVSKTTKWLVNLLLGMNFTDVATGYRCYNRFLLEKIDWEKIESKGYSFQIEISYILKNRGASIKEIPILFHERTRGKSKISFEIFFEAIIIVFKLALRRLKYNFRSRQKCV